MSFVTAAMEIKINGERVMRCELAISPESGVMPNIIGGGDGAMIRRVVLARKAGLEQGKGAFVNVTWMSAPL